MRCTLAMLNNPTALMILAAVVILFFGGNKIPEMMRGLGTGVKEFKNGLNEQNPENVPERENADTEGRTGRSPTSKRGRGRA